jgi:tol-pal system protein YbgF
MTQCWQGGWSNPQQLYRCGLSLVYARRYSEAIRIFQQFLNSYPQSSLADNALYWTGEAYYAQKQYYQALSYFQQILSRYPQGNKVPDALLKIALSYMSLNRDSEGCQMLNELQYRYPNSEPAQKAYRWMNRCGYWGGGGTGYYSQPYSSNTPQPWYSESVLPKYW